MTKKNQKILSVVGARPNFMKVAAIARALAPYADRFEHMIVHTGQHYDEKMSRVFFKELAIPLPDVSLGAGSGSHSEQTARIMVEFEKVCLKENPALVLIYGDVNSTLAAALVAAKLRVPLGHVEAGFRSFDRSMPEEINRLVSDVLSDLLFTPSPEASKNLRQEGVAKEKIHLVGDIMEDSLLFYKGKAAGLSVFSKLGLKTNEYAVMTLHRPGNVDSEENLRKIFKALETIARMIKVVFPMHPRTAKMVKKSGLKQPRGVKYVMPLGYLEFINLLMNSKFILSDSGGVQQESYVLNIPCLILRENTERQGILGSDLCRLVGHDTNKIVAAAQDLLSRKVTAKAVTGQAEGKTAQRIVEVLAKTL